MSIRGKTKYRLLILAVVAACVAALGSALYVVRSRQIAAELLRSRDAGLAALQAGDYYAALHEIGRYSQRHPEDVAALYAYAQARQNVPMQGGEHLLDAVALYRRVLDLQPGHTEAGHRLLNLYLDQGYGSETLTLADQLLQQNANDTDALRSKAITLARLRKFGDALAAASRHNELLPLNVEFQFVTLQIMRQAGETDEKLLAYAQGLVQAHPDDQRPELVAAYASLMAGDKAGALRSIRKVAAGEITDPELITQTVRLLDAMGQFGEALSVVERVAGPKHDRRTTELLVERWWQMHQWQRIVDYLGPAIGPGHIAGSRIAALHATALLELGRREEADAIASELSRRRDDTEAAAWAELIPVVYATTRPDPAQVFAVCNDAVSRVPSSPYFRLLLARAAAQMGEYELAMEYCRRASELAPSWSAPLLEHSRLLLRLGRTNDAVAAAQEARRRAPQDPQTLAALATAGVQMVNANATQQAASLNEVLDQLQRIAPGNEQAVAARILLLARTGQREPAIQAIGRALEREPALSQETLLAMAAASESSALGQEDACYERCRTAHGISPDLAAAQARTLQRRGMAQDGLALFTGQPGEPRKGDPLEWRLAEARYRGEIGDADAGPQWIALADENPRNVRVQWAAEAARCLAADNQARERVLSRLQELIGSQGIAWRLARVRWLLSGQPSEKQVVEAATLLSDATRIVPEELQPHYLLGQCMERLNNPTVAIEQLTIVAEGDKSHHDAALRLARLLWAKGDTERARAYVNRVLQSGTLPASVLRRTAALMADLGDLNRAAQLVETLRQANASSRDSDLLLARIYWQQKQAAQAEILLNTLLKDPDQAVIRFALEFYLSQHRLAEAERAVAGLDRLQGDPAIAAAIRGDFYARTGRSEQALQTYLAGAEASPRNPVIWRALVLHHLSCGDVNAAMSAVDQAGNAAEQDEAIAALRRQHDAVTELAGEPLLPALLVAVLGQADGAAPACDTIEAMSRARKAGETPAQLARRLRPLADRNPRLLPLQLLLTRAYLGSGKPDEAVTIAQRATQLFPDAEEPARAAATVLAAAGRWAEALLAAQRWRTLCSEPAADADAAIARAYLGLKQADKALQCVQPYMEAAWIAPESQAQWILLWSQGQLRSGHAAQAERSLLPLIRTSAQWRKQWMQLAVEHVNAAVTSEQWLNMVAQYIPGDALDERIALAGAWRQFAIRTNSPQHRERAKQMASGLVKEVQESHDLRGEQVQLLATLCEAQNDRANASALYRQALKIDPKLGISMNNLAAILLEQGGDLAEAETLATGAVGTNPDVAAFHDTLAAIRLRRGQFGPAIESLNRAVELQPDNCAYRIRLAGVLLGNGQNDPARQMLKHVETFRPDTLPLSQRDREQLAVLRSRFARAAAP